MSTSRYFELPGIGAEPTLVMREIADTPPAPGHASVRIAACGLNFADLLVCRGQYQVKPTLPATLGMELAGTIEALGPDTAGPAPGTRVAVYAGGGGLADRGHFPAARCLSIPSSMSFEVAAGFQVAYGTSHLALAHKARLQPGETLLVLGAASGVGLTAVEIGKLMGARVIASARGPEKLRAAEAAGADHLIDSSNADVREAARALGGVDVVYDPVGGDGFTAALGATRPGGRLLVIGFASGEVPPIKANHLLVKNLDVLGFWWGGYLDFAPRLLDDSLATLMGWYEAGRLRPQISHVLPLERAAEGLELLRSRRARGKVVITT